MEKNNYVSVDQFAMMTGLSRARIYQLIDDRHISYVVIDGLLFIHKNVLELLNKAGFRG